MDYSNEEFLNAVRKWVQSKKSFFNREVQQYYQTGITCGSCCLMIVLNKLEGFDISRANEFNIFRSIQIGDYPNNPSSGLAMLASSRGYPTKLVHSDPDYFHYAPTLPPEDFVVLVQGYKDHVERGKEHGLTVQFNEINSVYVKGLVEEGAFVVPILDQGYGMLHDVVIHGYNKRGFLCFDPISGKREIRYRDFDELVIAPYGSWLFAVYDKSHQAKEGLKSKLHTEQQIPYHD